MIRGPRIIHGCPWGGPGVILRGACLGCAQIGASWVGPTDHPRVEPWARPRFTQWVVHPRVIQGAPPALQTPGLAPGASLDHPTKAQPESEVWVVLGRPVVPSWVDPLGRDGTRDLLADTGYYLSPACLRCLHQTLTRPMGWYYPHMH